MNALLLIAGGLALYLWYTQQGTSTVVTPTQPQTPPTGTTPTVTPTTTGTTTGTTTPTTPAVTVSPSPQPGPIQTQGLQTRVLDKMYQDMVSQASSSGDPAISGSGDNTLASGPSPWSVWNWYLIAVSGQATLPDYFGVTGQTDPNTPLTAAQYWALMKPWLMSNRGLSGLGLSLPRFSQHYSKLYGAYRA